jgi:hypothetical protein
MKIGTRIIQFLIIGLIILTSAACMKEPKNEANKKVVRALVETYCKADFDGANLSTDNYKKSPLPGFVISGEYEAPAWDTVSLVKAYSIRSVEVNGENASVVVMYEVLGEVPGAQEVVIKKENVNYTFTLRKQRDSWKLITPAELMPHIAVDTAIRHIRELYETQKEFQPNAPKVIKSLQALKQSSEEKE